MTVFSSSNPCLPFGWSEVSFDEAFEVCSDMGKRLQERDYLESGRFPVVDQGLRPVAGYANTAEMLFDGDLPVILFGDHTRRVKLVDFRFIVGADGIKILRNLRALDPRYLWYHLRAIRLEDRGYSRHFQYLRKERFRMAPAAEQRRIVAKIEELFSDLDAGAAALERVKANLARYRASVLQAAVEGRLTEKWREANPRVEPTTMLLQQLQGKRRAAWDQLNPRKTYKATPEPDQGTLPELPSTWCWTTVSRVADVQGGIQKQPSRAPKDNAYPYLRVANVLRDRLDLSEIHFFQLFGDELSRLRLVRGDLLVVEGNGSRTEIGRSALWNGEIDNCVHQNHIIRVRLEAGDPGFLNIYWNSPQGRRMIMDVAASTSGLYTLSVSKVSSLALPTPPLDEQRQIVREVEARFSVLDKVSQEMVGLTRRSSRLRQSILKDAFEGKLVPQDPSDEPASALLERIKAERLASAGIKLATKRGRKPKLPSGKGYTLIPLPLDTTDQD